MKNEFIGQAFTNAVNQVGDLNEIVQELYKISKVVPSTTVVNYVDSKLIIIGVEPKSIDSVKGLYPRNVWHSNLPFMGGPNISTKLERVLLVIML